MNIKMKKNVGLLSIILFIVFWLCPVWADNITTNQFPFEQAKSANFDIEFWYGVPKGDDCTGKPGDFNSNGSINMADIIGLVNHLFHGAPRSDRICLSDPNADGKVNMVDLVYLVNFIYKGGPKPVPSGDCCIPP